MPTEEEQERLERYRERIADLEVDIFKTNNLMKDLKDQKKEYVQLYYDLEIAIKRKENDTTLDDFKGEEGTQDFDPSCPECNSVNISDTLVEGESSCDDCGHTFVLQGPDEGEYVVTCPKCESGGEIEIDENTGMCTCQECEHEFLPKMPDVEEDPEAEDDGEPNPLGGDEVQEERVQWLTDTPPNDINFKMNLDNANLATVNKAIEIVDGMPRCKGRLKILNTRKTQLEAEAEKVDDDDAVQEDSA